MKPLIAIALCAALAGCATSPTNLAVGTEIASLCADGSQRYAKLTSPSKLQQGAKKVLDAACQNPQATADVIVSVYKVITANKS